MSDTKIVIYQSEGNREQANNPYGFTKEFQIEPGDTDMLARAVQYDNCLARYKDGYKKGDNFIEANCILADIDNTHSDNSDEWITHVNVIRGLSDVEFYYYPSRNNMKQKGERAPRPKEHFIFPIDHVTSVEEYCNIMKQLIDTFPELHFDIAVKGGAQLNFGVENPNVEYVKGNTNLSTFMKNYINSVNIEKISVNENMSTKERLDMRENTNAGRELNIIPEGTRNNTLYQYALKVLTRWGDTSKTYEDFMNESQKCVPPMDSRELSTIWNGACKYYNSTIKTNGNYVSPEKYNISQGNSDWVLSPVNPVAVQQLYRIEKKQRVFNIATAKLILEAVGITIRLNDMNGIMEVNGLPKKYNHEDSSNLLTTLVADIANCMSYKRATAPVVQESLNVIANENHYHPVIELIAEDEWDKKDRLSEIFNMLNLKENLYKTLVKKWAIQTIALLFNSNTNSVSAEGVLVLQGEQGIGKTQFFRHLAIYESFFKGGATLDMGNKDCLMSATKVWICELGEIDSTTKKEQSALKAFLTENTDRFRAPYARCETVKVRRTSFCGTVNPKQYLRDETGNRRYWTIPIEKIELKKVFGYSPEWYTQFWRQILEEYKADSKGYLLTEEEKRLLNENNKEYEATSFGEDEFLTYFDIQSDRRNWKWLTASQIAQLLNEECKQLHISSVQMGKLLKRIEQRLDISFGEKKVRGTKKIHCPPLCSSQSENEPSIQNLPDYDPINSNNMNTDDELLTDENITF